MTYTSMPTVHDLDKTEKRTQQRHYMHMYMYVQCTSSSILYLEKENVSTEKPTVGTMSKT